MAEDMSEGQRASDGVITQKVYFEREFANVRRDIDTLNKTIKDTAEAHAAAHDRDHKQTETATNKAEASLTIRLDQMKDEFAKAGDERKRQIDDIKASVERQENQWSRLQGLGMAFGALLGLVSIAGLFLSLWAAFAK